jgi:hypothetical protein
MADRYRHQWYERIHAQLPAILEDARRAGEKLGLGKAKGNIGLYAGTSACPARLPDYVMDAIVRANESPLLPLQVVEDELREVVKDIYGDDYDTGVANTCDAALRVACETLFAPPTMRKGEAYRARVILPYGEDFEWGGGYGRAFPPKYKSLAIDRSVTAGELGVEGKSLPNLDTVFVRYAGARYEVHGIRQSVTPLLTRVDARATAQRIRDVADRHAGGLAGFQCVGYDTPGYGHGERDGGVPVFLRQLGELAERYDVPFLVDAASCLPGVGLSPKDIRADVMVWSMDKAGRSPIAGLMVGKAEPMNVIRKALGLGGPRYGGVSSHGKAAFSLADPGRDSLVGLTAFLRVVRDDPARITRPIDRYYDILVEELREIHPVCFREKLIITKSYHMGGIELNYAGTWSEDAFGIPIFTLEDSFANTNVIELATAEMGVAPATVYSGNIFLGPGLLLDKHGELIEEDARLGLRALVRSLDIVCEHAGLLD